MGIVHTSIHDADAETGAWSAQAYENQSCGIVDTLNGLLGKAEHEATKEKTCGKNKYDMLKQCLTDEIKYAHKDLNETKKGLPESNEAKSSIYILENFSGIINKEMHGSASMLKMNKAGLHILEHLSKSMCTFIHVVAKIISCIHESW